MGEAIIMKTMNGNTHWRNRFMKLLIVLVVLVGIRFGYSVYYEGNIRIDDTLIRRIEQSGIADKWNKLEELAAYVTYYDENSSYIALLDGMANDLDIENVMIIVRSDRDGDDIIPNVDARYTRASLFELLYGLRSPWECRSTVFIETSDCMIYMVDYDSDGTGKSFEVMLQKILAVIEN